MLKKLTRGKATLIDDEDEIWFSRYSFYCAKMGSVYKVQANTYDKPRRTVVLARLIMNAPKDLVVDHINGNPLDNRKQNLRLCSVRENSRNRVRTHQTRRRQSRYKGVTIKGSKFVAQICVDYKRKHIGMFDTEEAAAKAYNDAALKNFGKFAALNNV